MRPKASSAVAITRCGSPGPGEIGGDVEVARALGAPARAGDARALGLEQPHGLEPDPLGRAGDDAHLVLEAQIHRRLR